MRGATVLDMPVDEVRAVLERGYALVPDQIEVVSGEIATVCRVRAGADLYAFKAMPACGDEAAALVKWQVAAMVRLTDSGLPVPAVRPDANGRPLFELESGGLDVLVLVTDWLSDPPLSDVAVDNGLLREVGRTAAQVSLQLLGFDPPVAASHPWELVRTHDSIGDALPHVVDDATGGLVRRALEVFDIQLVPLLPGLPRTVVHHDLNDSNLLVGAGVGGDRGITGVLDFGDIVVGPRLAELAVAAAYAARNTPDPRASLIEVVMGWSSVSTLTAGELRGLLPAAISRLGTNLAIWATRHTGSRTSYAASRAVGTADTLRALLDVDPSDFLKDLRRAVHA